jgi:hypothetical protein
MNLNLMTAKVISIDDPDKEGKIKIKISPAHKDLKDIDLPWAVPFTTMLFSSTSQNDLPEINSILWVLVQEDWQRFYFIGNRYFYDYFSFNDILSQLNQATEITGKTYTDLKFRLYKDSGLDFHNNNTGEHGFIHKSGSYTVFDANGNMCVNTKTKDVKVKGMNVEVEATTKVTVKGSNVEINATTATIKGGTFTMAGVVTPGSGPFNCLGACIFSGAPHSGSVAVGT